MPGGEDQDGRGECWGGAWAYTFEQMVDTLVKPGDTFVQNRKLYVFTYVYIIVQS